jgi:ABC-2 type transport system permease protein
MTTLLRAEHIKLRTTRTFVALAAVAAGLSLLLTVLTGVLSDPARDEVVTQVFANDASSAFILILAVIGITGEWRHRTITGALLAAPDRLRFLAAKAIAYAGAGLVLSLLISLTVTVVGLLIVGVRGLPEPGVGELVEYIARSAGLAALLGAFGVALGALVRNQVGAIVGVLAAMFLLEPMVLAVLPEVGRFGPFIALPTAATGIDPDAVGLGESNLLGPELATLTLLGWIGLAFAAGYAVLRCRDVES